MTSSFTNSIGMEFVLIPAGTFELPEVVKKNDFDEDIRYRLRVTVDEGFYLGKYPVTQEQWVAVMGEGSNPSQFRGRHNPVENVSWDDAQLFIRALNNKDDSHHRLPLEVEWELAARAGTDTPFFFGDTPERIGEYAWFNGNADGRAHPVGQKEPNPHGLHDMYGNVQEWMQDTYVTLPDTREVPYNKLLAIGGPNYVIRGGAWADDADDCRSDRRACCDGNERRATVGFRLALIPPKPEHAEPSEQSRPAATLDVPSVTKKLKNLFDLVMDRAEKIWAASVQYGNNFRFWKPLCIVLGLVLIWLSVQRGFPQYVLGMMRLEGTIVAKDGGKAEEWFLMAADKGHAAAQHNLGVMYLEGVGVPRNYQNARAWFAKAAEQGLVQSQGALGAIFFQGLGVPKNKTLAAVWLKKAADQGDTQARELLELCYKLGISPEEAQALASQEHLHPGDGYYVEEWFPVSPAPKQAQSATPQQEKSLLEDGGGKEKRSDTASTKSAENGKPASQPRGWTLMGSFPEDDGKGTEWKLGGGQAQVRSYTNSIGMEFVLIPAGSFMMGDASPDEWMAEVPQHKVTISKPFYLGKYEVTQAQWEAVMGNNPSTHKGGNNPVENVSWDDAQKFVSRLNVKEGHARYRLPTEAEWEYAARAGTGSLFFFGNDVNELSGYAWYDANSGGRTRPVGQKRASSWGLYDIYGNVREWTQDWYDADYYASSPRYDPEGPASGSGRVVRGGDWRAPAGLTRSAARFYFSSGHRDYDLGFRLLLSSE